MVLDTYLDKRSAHRQVPQDVVNKLRQMAESDPDKDVRRAIRRYLRELWAQPSMQ